jgi:hypothetical protein
MQGDTTKQYKDCGYPEILMVITDSEEDDN